MLGLAGTTVATADAAYAGTVLVDAANMLGPMLQQRMLLMLGPFLWMLLICWDHFCGCCL